MLCFTLSSTGDVLRQHPPRSALQNRCHERRAPRPRRGRPRVLVCSSQDDEISPLAGPLAPASPRLSPRGRPLCDTLRDRVLYGFEPTPELAAILAVYFVQGALGISRLAITFFLKDELHLGPAEVASLTAVAALPWLIKPVYGVLTDSLPLFGYRRRSYLIGAGLIGAASWAYLATAANSVPAVTIASVMTAGSVAVSDVVADSLVVERVRGKPAATSGALQSLCWSSCAVGGLLSAYLSGGLLEVFSARQIFAGTAALPLLTASLAGLIVEGPMRLESVTAFGEILRNRFKALWGALSDRSVYLPVLFIFLWQAAPNPDAAMFFFNTNVLGFGPEFLGRVRLASAGAALLGLWSYQRYFRHLDIKKIMLGATLASLPLALTQVLLVTRANVALGIPDKIFALTDTAVLAALGQVAFMPTLVLAARLCPPGVEGTLFAALMSVYNASGATSNELGSLLMSSLRITETDFTNLWKLIVICGVSSLAALPLLSLIDAAPPEVADDDGDDRDLAAVPAAPHVVGVAAPVDDVSRKRAP
jgi:folate/biopterin transporter